MSRSTLFNLLALAIFAAGTLLFFSFNENQSQTQNNTEGLPASVAIVATSSKSTSAPSPATTTPVVASTTHATATTTLPKKAQVKATNSSVPSVPAQAQRVQNPYTAQAESFPQINSDTRAALVNILCESGNDSLLPISGSGVIIDPRGVILTNAHVAQYVLLSESPAIDLTCYVRTGSPAEAHWHVGVLYIPPVWVSAHASEIVDQHPTGTGEHDYALLIITGSLDGSPVPNNFPALPYDTREAIAFPGDQVLVGSYPAEFLGGIAAQYNLYADTSVTTVKEFLTFSTSSPDVISLGGIIEAQSGSSGGAVVNEWGRLVALISTTSNGTTTADRDLHAITLSYINQDLEAQSGQNLDDVLAGDPLTEAESFTRNTAPSLVDQYVSILSTQQQ